LCSINISFQCHNHPARSKVQGESLIHSSPSLSSVWYSSSVDQLDHGEEEDCYE
jgi:hypothetical protein